MMDLHHCMLQLGKFYINLTCSSVFYSMISVTSVVLLHFVGVRNMKL